MSFARSGPYSIEVEFVAVQVTLQSQSGEMIFTGRGTWRSGTQAGIILQDSVNAFGLMSGPFLVTPGFVLGPVRDAETGRRQQVAPFTRITRNSCIYGRAVTPIRPAPAGS